MLDELKDSLLVNTKEIQNISNKGILMLAIASTGSNAMPKQEVTTPELAKQVSEQVQVLSQEQEQVLRLNFTPNQILENIKENSIDFKNADMNIQHPILDMAQELANQEGMKGSELIKEIRMLVEYDFDFDNYVDQGNDGVDPTEIINMVRDLSKKEGVSPSQMIRELQMAAETLEFKPELSNGDFDIRNVEASKLEMPEYIKVDDEIDPTGLFELAQTIAREEGIQMSNVFRELRILAENDFDFKDYVHNDNDGFDPTGIFEMVEDLSLEEGIKPDELLQELEMVSKNNEYNPQFSNDFKEMRELSQEMEMPNNLKIKPQLEMPEAFIKKPKNKNSNKLSRGLKV